MNRVDDLDKYWSETIEDMQNKIEDVKSMVTHHVGS